MRLPALALLALALASGACRRIHAGPEDEQPLAEAQRAFDRDVYPIIVDKCAECHSDATFERVPARFVDDDDLFGWFTASRFVSLTGPFMTNQAPILKRIANGHYEATYTPDEIAAIERWLNIELSIRSGLPVETAAGLPTLADDELAMFRGCMTFEDFESRGMQLWGDLETVDGQRCASCHATGAGGFIATTDARAMYEAIRRSESLFLQYLTVQAFGSPEVHVSINYIGLDIISTGDDPHRSHPRFDAFDGGPYNALQGFQLATENHVIEGNCTPSPFPTAKAP